jgi:hypothetical protein
MTTTYPMEAGDFGLVSTAIAARFHETLTGSWVPAIYQQVEKIVRKDFKINNKKMFTVEREDQLNPILVRFFRQVHM